MCYILNVVGNYGSYIIKATLIGCAFETELLIRESECNCFHIYSIQCLPVMVKLIQSRKARMENIISTRSSGARNSNAMNIRNIMPSVSML